jgi:hypothetical protein
MIRGFNHIAGTDVLHWRAAMHADEPVGIDTEGRSSVRTIGITIL